MSRLLRAKAILEKGDKELRIQKVFTSLPRDFIGAPSPEGRYLSTVDWDTGDLAIKEIATGKQRRLTDKGTWQESLEYALFSIWSPDGKKVAYSWFNEENFFELRIIGLDGKESRILYRNREKYLIEPFDWSPDGKNILAGLAEQQRATQIAAISAQDGSVQILKEGLINSGLYAADGNFIIYDFIPRAQKESRGSDISLFPAEGGEEIPLVKHPAHDFSLGWDPQGKRLLFVSDRTGNMDIWALDVENGRPQGKPYLLQKNMGRAYPLGFTQDGALYYQVYTGMEDVYTTSLDLEKNSLLALPQSVEKLFMGANHSPDFSPDGKHLAYISRRTFGPGRFEPLAICILSLESGDKREFFPDLEHMRFIRWSKDGENLFSYGFDNENRRGLYAIDAQTGKTDFMFACKPDEFIPEFDVFPDGRKIVYKSYKRGKAGMGAIMSIRVRDIPSGKEEEIYHKENAWETHHVALSSDGKWIAFDDRVPLRTLYIIEATGGEPRELYRMKSGESFTSFAWRPGARDIFFTKSISGEPNQLWRVNLEGEEPQRIDLSMRRLGGLCFHPDAMRIAFRAGYLEAEVWVMENLLRLEKVEKIFK